MKLTKRCECGVVHARSRGASGVSPSTEPVILIRSHVAPAAHVGLKVALFRIRALSVQQQHVVKGHVSLVRGTSLLTFNHYL